MFEFSDSNPFILMKGSSLSLPSGIMIGEEMNGIREIPLIDVELSNDVFHFIRLGAEQGAYMILTVPADIILGDSNVKVTSVDFDIRRAEAVLV